MAGAKQDKHGRTYAKLSELRVGSEIMVDGDFTCCEAGDIFRVQDMGKGLAFACDEGSHLLIGQADDGEHCVGVYLVRK